MKAWRVHEWCEPHGMKFEDVPLPEVFPGTVRVHVRAAALNFFDVLLAAGTYQVKPPFPFTPGAEVAGVVDAVGEGVTHVKQGDRVLALPQIGGYAEAALAPANRTFAIPDTMTFEEAAAMPIVYHTSHFALHERARLQSGEWLLVHAGASGVGMSAIQIGKAMGARIIATASNDDKLRFCAEQGADHTVAYNDASWIDAVKEITGGRGADVIYDPVGADVFDQSTKIIASEGRLLVIGFAAGRIPEIAANRILLKNMSVVGVFWGGYVEKHPDYPAAVHEALMGMYARGEIRPIVSRRTPLAEAPDAMGDLTSRRLVGKAVLTAG